MNVKSLLVTALVAVAVAVGYDQYKQRKNG
jgi:hypothetical protein